MTENELRQQICDQAKSWLGRKESDGTHRVIIDVYNSITPLPRGYRMTYDDPWCATFVSACAQVWGLTDIVFPECACDPMIALYKAHGRWMENDAYRPNPGDVIFYDWDDAGYGDNTGSSDHVGLVINVSGNVINIIEGNCGNMVQYTARAVNSRYIRGFGLPDYASKADTVEAPAVVVIPDEPEEPVEEAKTCTVTLPILRLGDDSEAVRAAQILLEKRGFKCGWMGADGEFGTKTEAALGKFKRDRDLQRTAEIDAEAWESLICE